MSPREALDLLTPAVPAIPGTWADFGAGGGTFTRALAARLGAPSCIYAVDRDGRALASIERWAWERETRAADASGPPAPRASVITVLADISAAIDLPGLGPGRLDGMLFANSLHYLSDPRTVLRRLAGLLRAGGRAVVVEYDDRPASPWVPFPLPAARLPELAAAAGLEAPNVVARTPSVFGGTIYVASADAPAVRVR